MHVARKDVAPLHERLAQPAGPSTIVPSNSCAPASMAAPLSSVRQRPDAVEVLEREANRVHQLVAAGAGRVGAMPFHALAHRQAFPGVSSSGGTFGGGAGGGVPKMFVST